MAIRKDKILLTSLIAITLSIFVATLAPVAAQEYMGAEFCGMCHPAEYESWAETPHASAAGIEAVNETGTYYYVAAFAHRVYTEEAFLASCRNCHVTGWDEDTESWPEQDTDPGKFLGIQCEYCHGPYQSHGADNPAMTIDYSPNGCADCHRQPADLELSRHSQSLDDLLSRSYAGDTCLKCMSTEGFIGKDVTVETEGLESISCAACHDPHSIENHYQLRYETAQEVCAACHVGSHHPQAELFPDSAHDKADVECANCHGAGERLWHGSNSAWYNHTFWIYNINYPYDQEEPMVCAQCHELEWATEQLETVQSTTEGFFANATEVVHAAEEAITAAGAAGATEADLAEATELWEEAEAMVHWVEADGSNGFHNTERALAMVNYAAQLAGEAQAEAKDAIADILDDEKTDLESEKATLESEKAALESDKADLESDVDTLTSDVSTLESQVSNLETEVDELSAKAGSTMNYAIGAIIGLIIGAVAVFFLKK
jgi:predicted CXXCH cytochrome family protein